MVKKCSAPAVVVAVENEVHLETPGCSISLEPGAAIETGHRLIDKGLTAARFFEEAPVDNRS